MFLMDSLTAATAELVGADKLQSFEQVMDFYMPMVYRIAFSRLKNREESEDAVQDVFLRCFNANPEFESEEHRKAWLIRCTINRVNTIASSARIKHRANPLGLENTSEEGDYEEPVDHTAQSFERSERKTSVLNAVDKLPDKYRDVIYLFYFEDMSITQISRALGIKESTIKSQLSRARAMLKPLLEEEVEF